MFTDTDAETLSALVARLKSTDLDAPARLHAEHVMASFLRVSKRRRRSAVLADRAAHDAAIDAATATGSPDRHPDAALAAAGGGGRRIRQRSCYICKTSYQDVDGFYHLLCRDCATDNRARRAIATDLTGRRVLLTGGRVKIGFHLATMMLRDGAELLVTSRFPADTLRRFAAVPDAWRDRLTVIGVDLRDPRQVVGLCDRLLADGRPLDILVNNAAQTIRRPPHAYAALIAAERAALPGMDRRVLTAPGFRTVDTPPTDTDLAPVNAWTGLLPDDADTNSWTARLGDLDPAEILETQLVNAVAPLLLCDRLLPLLLASPSTRRYIVNVSAVEGRFSATHKTPAHPHTNMAKAAVNMLTRTSGPALAERGVYMCAVDTGWVTDEHPEPRARRRRRAGFRTPLDVVDGAARVYDPIVRGEAGDPVAGVFLKDYREASW